MNSLYLPEALTVRLVQICQQKMEGLKDPKQVFVVFISSSFYKAIPFVMAHWIAFVKLTESMEHVFRGELICSDFLQFVSARSLSYLFVEGNNDHDDQDSIKSFIAANNGFS